MGLAIYVLCMFIGAVGFVLGVAMLRAECGHRRCARYIAKHQIASGIFVKHGMGYDPETRSVKGTTSPSAYGIDYFSRGNRGGIDIEIVLNEDQMKTSNVNR